MVVCQLVRKKVALLLCAIIVGRVRGITKVILIVSVARVSLVGP